MCNDPSCGENSCDCLHTACPCIDRTKLSNAIDLGIEGKPFCGTPMMNNNCKDSTFDGTDAACPAYWRGQNYGVNAAAILMHDMLNNFDKGNYELVGQFEPEYLTNLRLRLFELHKRSVK